MTEKQYKVGYFEDPNPVDSYVENSDGEYLNASDVAKLLNKLSEENKELKQTIKTIKEICNQKRIPSFLTTYIPVNCEKRKGCLDNHVVNASNMGKSNLAREILELI